MSVQPHDHIIPFQESEKAKKEQVAEMFDSIAGKYDFMNRFLSARTDVSWRKKAINSLRKYQPQYILDIATGTGDMAIRACKMLDPTQITGVDISTQMLHEGRKKIEKLGLGAKINLQKGDSENLQFDANHFDVVMAAFGVRNFENLEKGLSEMLRVLKPGGQLCIIEFSRPKPGIIKWFYQIYMSIIAPQIASVFRQNKEAYKYLNKSANAFPERKEFVSILNKVGYKNSTYKALTFGMCCIYSASK
ncbi:MAG TPA: bifunctional demethylmenaquinone methyltransferase/2-methoxy-6-polyprenyl-1,4-benzoquinol methylase UbiE [Niabella sp.]|nr:bifunctional demethylmenaquinone methyltransferase/2-methoxy-6-polyprenyl-1,4-benzoquinol methylase UbiE [Niabella sp.]HOZ97655.1 bifunctional demethylmenaquinone methyltransferase/2-methoxy-6-polyprenyl-1,4-benzoquinol methylase UbiE [Niabella sp.]HQW13961.1 bifunctional demethylmenaquinone methyltransferase/2-methoxy-6-polyprenyl-1,4-benzoquinol methylase UbiE [Niabella sp.]HQX19496.1 bifunctional demethylmenaquinone methyltransferase/2-methoxy-6-polyprenyl-1,4-benzoquinol methylase UbiE [N